MERGSLEPVKLGRLREWCERLKSEQNLAKFGSTRLNNMVKIEEESWGTDAAEVLH